MVPAAGFPDSTTGVIGMIFMSALLVGLFVRSAEL